MREECSKLIQKVLILVFLLLVWPGTAWALQVHDAPEGYVVHQVAHVFFLVCMGVLAYWLQSNRLVEKRGWRYIQGACLLFLLWNICALAGHWIARDITSDMFLGSGTQLNQRLLVPQKSIEMYLYYFLHMDNLLCAPAVFLLFLGIRSFYKTRTGTM
jgi:hypothetical protein